MPSQYLLVGGSQGRTAIGVAPDAQWIAELTFGSIFPNSYVRVIATTVIPRAIRGQVRSNMTASTRIVTVMMPSISQPWVSEVGRQ